MLVLSLREATTVLKITKGTTVQTRTRRYDGNDGYAGYDGTKCNEEDTNGRKRYEGLRYVQVNDDEVLSVQKIRERT